MSSTSQPSTLIQRLLRLAEIWAAAQGHSTTSRLSTIVANDGGLLKRLGEGGGATVATLDKFVHYLRADANWPAESIPVEAQGLLAAIGHLVSLPGDADRLDDLVRREATARKVA